MSIVTKTGWRAMGRFAAGLSLLALAATACGGSSDDSGTVTGSPTTVAGAATTQATGATTTAAASSGNLAGTWAGDYTQTKPTNATGTFGVTFAGSAPSYTGTITIPTTCDPSCPITATVTGATITFGAIGPYAITFDGTISGSSMSGTYKVGSGEYEGTWKALRA